MHKNLSKTDNAALTLKEEQEFDSQTLCNSGQISMYEPEIADVALSEYLDEYTDIKVTSPSDVDFDKREDVIKEIRKKIENTIKPKWDSFEYSRLFDTNSIFKSPTLTEVKRALMPYIRSGWYATVSFVSPENKNLLVTYEANADFLIKKYGRKDYQDQIFVRMYPKTPQKLPFINKMAKGHTAVGAFLFLTIISVSIAMFFLIGKIVLPISASLLVVSFILASHFKGTYIALSKKKKSNKKIGPLLWADNIEGYKTVHKTVTKEDRIKQVVKTRVMAHEDD